MHNKENIIDLFQGARSDARPFIVRRLKGRGVTICPLPLPKSDYGLIGISSAVIPETCIINEVFNISLLTA